MTQENKTIAYYNKQAEEYYKQTVNVDLNVLYKQFLSYLEDGSHILDAGCGSGRDSLYFIEQGYEVTAIDAAEELAQLAEELIGQEVLTTRLQDLNFKAEFDGVWACASLLHLKSEQVKLVLENFAQALVARGIIYISVKYGQGEERINGRFFKYYTAQSFINLVTSVEGLEVLESWQTTDRKEVRVKQQWLNFLIRKVD